MPLSLVVSINYNLFNFHLSRQDFNKSNNRAIDEIWYKRAVEQHFIEPQSFVFSVPFDIGDSKEALVTASHAVFHVDEKKSAPVAVVGFQFQHSALFTLFKNITSTVRLYRILYNEVSN